MAGKNWFLTATTLSGWRALSETGQVAATLIDGWILGKSGAVNVHSAYYSSVKRPALSFAGTADPDGVLDTVNHDALIAGPYNGTFAPGTWTFSFVFRPTTAGNQRVALYLRLLRGANVSGAGAVQITTAQQAGGTTAALTSTATDYTSQVTFNPGAFTLANEYLFVQLGLRRVALGSKPQSDAALRTGVSAVSGTRIASADFTAVAQSASLDEGSASAADASSVVSMGYGLTLEEGDDTAIDTAAASSLTVAALAEGAPTAEDTCAASVVAGTPRIGRVAWIRMIAPREAAQSASVIEGGPTAQDTCDAKFAIAASINEGTQSALDSVSARAVYACELAEGSPISFDTAVETANIVTYATIEELGAGHDDVHSQFDPATAFMQEGADTALDLVEATVVQPSAVAEGAATALDTCAVAIVLPVLMFEGGDSALDTVTCGVAFDVSVAEGAESAVDGVAVEGAILGTAAVEEGEPTAADTLDAEVERNAFIEEGDDTALDAPEAGADFAVAVNEGDDTAEDVLEATAGWYVAVEEGADTAFDTLACDLGDRHFERDRRFLKDAAALTYVEQEARAMALLATERARRTLETETARKVDETTREVEVVGGDAPTRLFDK